jgi:hypothetical protein
LLGTGIAVQKCKEDKAASVLNERKKRRRWADTLRQALSDRYSDVLLAGGAINWRRDFKVSAASQE